MKKITIKDIATEANVDVSTVSRALNHSTKISEPVKKKIWEIAKKRNYAPNIFARGLTMKKSYSVSLVLPDFGFMFGGFFQEVMRGIEQELDERAYTLILTKLDNKKRNGFLHLLNGGGIDGALILGDTVTEDDIQFLSGLEVPTVLLNKENKFTNKNYVELQNVLGGEMATKHLVRHKYERYIFLGGDKNFQVTQDRQKGFLSVLHESMINKQNITMEFGSFARGLEFGYTILKDLKLSRKMSTGIFAGSDTIALGALKYLEENNYIIGKDVGIIGYDDLDVDAYQSVPLTSVRQQAFELGCLGAKLLIDKIEEKNTEEYFSLAPSLSIRHSCGC